MNPRLKRKVIIDTDPGTDDAIALLMALLSGELEVVGITTVGGNARISQTTRNALRILEYAGRPDIPVAVGAGRPLRGRFTYAYDFHGPGGLTVRLPRPKTRPVKDGALDFLRERLRQHPGQVTVVALGPLTNIARLLRKDPNAAGRIREMVVMGGAVNAPGNVTPYAEFNFYNDPLAAQVVLSSGIPTTLVDLRVCREALIRREAISPFLKGRREARLVGRILGNWFSLHPDKDAYDLCDPLAMAVAIEPGLLTTRRGAVRVETEDPLRRGETTTVEGEGVAIPMAVDREGFFRLLGRLFRIKGLV